MARTVVFDIGGVLVPEGTRMRQLQEFTADILEIPLNHDAFTAAYWEHRDGYDRGGSDAEFWQPVLAAAGASAATAAQIAAVAGRDAELNSAIAPEPLALLHDLAQDAQLAILSNAPLPMARAVRERDWAALFGVLAFSSELGLMKPQPEIYRHLDRVLADRYPAPFDPADVHFFDDRERNTAAATAHGWHAHLWQNPSQARAELHHP